MIVYDLATKVLDTEIFPQQSSRFAQSGAFAMKGNTHTHTHARTHARTQALLKFRVLHLLMTVRTKHNLKLKIKLLHVLQRS